MTILQIIHDVSPESPREWDNLGTMICNHSRYSLGDESFNSEDYSSWNAVRSFRIPKPSIVLPLYLYDHGGITISTTPFSCQWDSGQVGWIYVTDKKAREELGYERISRQRRETIARYLRGEVETYDQYLRGDIWGYQILEDDEIIDSCYGFYGEDDAREAGQEAKQGRA